MTGNESRKDLISEPFASLKIEFCQPQQDTKQTPKCRSIHEKSLFLWFHWVVYPSGLISSMWCVCVWDVRTKVQHPPSRSAIYVLLTFCKPCWELLFIIQIIISKSCKPSSSPAPHATVGHWSGDIWCWLKSPLTCHVTHHPPPDPGWWHDGYYDRAELRSISEAVIEYWYGMWIGTQISNDISLFASEEMQSGYWKHQISCQFQV